MCVPFASRLLVTAVSSIVDEANKDRALRRQDKATAGGIRRQGVIQSAASKRVGEQIEDIQTSTGESERAESLDDFLGAIRESRGATEGALDPILAANPRFAEDVAGGKKRIATAGTEQADRLSRIDAPLLQRQAEAGRVSRTAGDVSEFARQSSIEDFLTRLRVASIRPDAFISALATIGKGIGSVAPSTLGPSAANAAGGAQVHSVFNNPFFSGRA
ncbi:MAG: hypothetical protein V3V10_05225 [Planctomycetota bacterium]